MEALVISVEEKLEDPGKGHQDWDTVLGPSPAGDISA